MTTPAGWQLVPKQDTQQMRETFWCVYDGDRGGFSKAYRAMLEELAAAPKPPSTAEPVGDDLVSVFSAEAEDLGRMLDEARKRIAADRALLVQTREALEYVEGYNDTTAPVLAALDARLKGDGV